MAIALKHAFFQLFVYNFSKKLPPLKHILTLPTQRQKCADSVLHPFTFDNFNRNALFAMLYYLIAFPYYRKIAYIRVPQSKAIRSTIIRVEVFSRQPRWPCCSVSNEAKSNDCRSNSMGLLDGWVLRFIGHHILSDWRAFDLPESYAKKDSHFQCAAFDILLDANQTQKEFKPCFVRSGSAAFFACY